MNYYKFHIGDYRRDTVHLSLLEHGIYRALLDSYYLNEEPLTADLPKLMRSLCVRTAEEKQALENVLSDFFVLDGDVYRHKRCDQDIEKYKEKSEKARQSANARWADVSHHTSSASATESHSEENAIAMRTHSEGNANHKPLTTNHNKNTLVISDEIPGEQAESNNSSRQSVPIQEIVDLFNRCFPELPQVQKISEARRKAVRKRWLDNPELQTLADWEKFFRFVRRSDFLMGRSEKPWHGLCFDWMFNPTNFTKIYEGNYHKEFAA